MTSADETNHERDENVDWTRLGRAAEELARHVARDAARFAERVEEHARDFARDLGREWRRSERRHRRHGGGCEGGAEDLRRVFGDVRTFVGDVLDGVDGLIERLFTERARSAEEATAPPESEGWARVVANRDAVCAGCDAAISAGSEAFLRQTDGEPEFRCTACGEGQR